MKTTSEKSLVYRANSAIFLLAGSVLTLGLAVAAVGQGADTNRLETGGEYEISAPPTNMMLQITANATNAGDDNLVWSFSGRELAVDRSDPNKLSQPGNKYINILDVHDLANVQSLGARSSAFTNPLFPNVTCWTYNDDRILFNTWHHINPTNPSDLGRVMLMSCTATGAVSVRPFLQSDPQVQPTNHVYSPSVIFDPAVNKERLLFLVSSSTNNNLPNSILMEPNARINLYTVTFTNGSVPLWSDRVPLTAFNTNFSITSAKWCPELGTNYDPIANRLVILISGMQQQGTNPPVEANKIVILNDVQGLIANPAGAPTSLADPRIVILETNLTADSQVSWTFDGQYVMFGRLGTNQVSTDLYSKKTDNPTNEAVKFEIPSGIAEGQKQWLSISPDGMKAAFTVNHQVYIIPLQFNNSAVTNQATNIITDASYTEIDLSGAALSSNIAIGIVAPPSVDTNNLGSEYSGFAREFTVSGATNDYELLTNATMTLHFDEDDIPSDATLTNLAIYVYDPEGAGGVTGTWEMLESVVDTNLLTITSSNVEHFSVYTIARATTAITPDGPTIKANGQTNSITVRYPDTVTITVAMKVGSYPTDVQVDWWVIATANYSAWYYMDSTPAWLPVAFTGNNYSVFHPVHQGSLLDVSSTEVVPGIALPPGIYSFWFAVDYPADGVLNPSGPILYDQVTVTVQ